ncbi:MAG TPA: hypothetical protein PKB09_01300 [Candidatus Saccharibacteria bacterium]|nr:hypothetical protein [Candidatus Saccharibacteria bacterium]
MSYEDYAANSSDDLLAVDRGDVLPLLERVSLATLAIDLLLETDIYNVDVRMRNVFGKLLRSECREFTPGNTADSVGRRFDAIVAFAEIMEA